MPTIPYPDVPNAPGVPQVPRDGSEPGPISMQLGAVQTSLGAAMSNGVQWGIIDSLGNVLGSGTIAGITAGNASAVLSTNAVEMMRETRISDFPVEQGSFATYNKVILPANPTVTLALQGTASDRAAFLNQIDAACQSTELYSVVTPEVTYANYSIERYNLVRRAERGATLILVEISLKEIREVSASYASVTTPINKPRNPAATPQTNSGLVQPQVPQSVLSSAIGALWPSLGSN